MRVHVTLDGERNGEPVFIDVTADGESLVFRVPTVNRANACEFSIPANQLIAAAEHLKPTTAQEDA